MLSYLTLLTSSICLFPVDKTHPDSESCTVPLANKSKTVCCSVIMAYMLPYEWSNSDDVVDISVAIMEEVWQDYDVVAGIYP